MDLRYDDCLATFSDADIERLCASSQEPLKSTDHVTLQRSHDLFLHEQYAWESFKPDYAIIRLTQGYFAIVDKEDYRRVSRHKWYANVQRNEEGTIIKVYAARTETKAGKKQSIYLHRFVIRAGSRVIVDHKHGLTLDCRKGALRPTDFGGNSSNGRSPGRDGGKELKRGVELRFRGTRYGGQIKTKGKTKRSKKTWPLTPEGEEAAHQWYLREHQTTFSHRGLPELGVKAKYPVFPPIKTKLLPEFIPMPTSVVVDDIAATF
jgi:hypothetical protein